MKKDSWLEIGLYSVVGIILIGMIGWYTYYIWSDCLEENSVLTCMRMLN